MFLRRGYRLIILAALMLQSVIMYAGNNPEYRQTLFGKNGQLLANAQLYTFDINYEAYKNTSGAIEKTWYVKNTVRLMVDEESPWFISSDFTASIKLNITSENAAGVITNHPQKTLSIDYKTAEGQLSGAISSYEFRDAVKVTVTIAEAITKNVSWDVTKNLKLVNEIIALRDWGFNCTTALTGITTDSLFADEWKVKWNVPANFQDEYDLEWAWVDESAINDYKVNGVVDMEKVFADNATRISTSGNWYKIPLLYEGEGRIYARVRMTQQKVNGQRVEGSWFYLSDGGAAYLTRGIDDGHQDNLNWQATTTFAEEGKRKTVIQYFDGTLRGRQMVTKDNVSRTTVVAESFYDYQGRPVIQVLPSPTINTIIQFTKNVNQFDDTRNAKTVYDKLDPGQSSCNKLATKMLSTATGSASQYYSANNPKVNEGENKYIPDAEGYPYTETRYTNDGTGRIDAQGGVGPLFQVNSGKETKYYYESADQDDLDALFGTDAGYASHYSKNWVRDANGQYSVSYVDMRGKTIATALAGNTPANLQALPSYTSALKTVTRQLVDPETNNVHGNSIVSSKSLMVSKAGNFQFNYQLSPEKLRMLLCTGTEFCFDCLYELNISIIPDCSDKVIPGFTNPLVVRNFNLGEYLTSCAAGGSPLLNANFTVALEEGSYTVVKELKLSTEARDWYRENRFITNDTCKTKASFILQQYQLAIAQQNCYMTCTQCNTNLGTEADFVARFRAAANLTNEEVQQLMPQISAAYLEAKAACERICGTTTTQENTDELQAIKEMMLQDMTPPHGQYARLNTTEQPQNTNQPYNIFFPGIRNDAPLCPEVMPPYKKPVDYIGTATPQVLACGTGFKNFFGNTTLLKGHNLSPTDFTDDFEDSWANSLLYYHPEFAKLKYAEGPMLSSYLFGSKIQNTDTWQQALSNGIINTGLTTSVAAANHLINQDPLFALAGIPVSYQNRMRDAIISNFAAGGANCPGTIGMWRLAQLSVFCQKPLRDLGNQQLVNGCLPVPAPSSPYGLCYNSLTDMPPVQGTHCTADMDMVWKNFRALYLTFRKVLVSEWLTANSNVNYSLFNTTANGNNYKERFERYSSTAPYSLVGFTGPGGLLSDPADIQAAAEQEAIDICAAKTGYWMQRLRRCPQVESFIAANSSIWNGDSAWLTNYLVLICKQGVDYMGHPFGASSLPDGKPSVQIIKNPDGGDVSGITVRNFPQLIAYYLNFRLIALSAFCYPELIDYPKAYNMAPPTVSPPLIAVPDQCVCNRITYFKTQWENAGSPGTFSNYLLNTQGTVIAQDTLELLMNMCNTGYTGTNCNFLTKPYTIPAIFQCRGTANMDSSKTCITCADYTELKQKFLTERGVPAPYASPQTETEIAWNRAFADFANYRTGFNKLWTEYVQFGIICTNDTTLSCTNLNSLVAAWQATNPPQGGDSCRNSFVQFFNYNTGRSLNYNQWMDEFLKACGTKPPICQPVLTCGKLGSLINSYYNYYGYQVWRNSNCQLLFTQFVNDSLNTDFTWQDIVIKYNFLCGSECPLNICSFPNSHLLTKLYNHFKTQLYQSTWTLTQCQTNFTNWFNTQLGFTATPYTWSSIVTLYQSFNSSVGSCVPDINQLCAPPYSCQQLNHIRSLFYAQYPYADSLGNCQSLFAGFFNQQMGTGYTFAEIQNIYNAVCLTNLQVCTGGTYWDCCDLITYYQQFIDQFNSSTNPCPQNSTFCYCFATSFNTHYNKSYTYEEIKQLYLDHCGFTLMVCGQPPPVFTCEMLQNTLGAFVKEYPGGGCAGACQQFFGAFFNGRHSTLYTYTDISNLYLVQCGDSLRVCESKCPEYIAFVNNYISRYGTMKIPLQARRQLFESIFNAAFGYDGPAGGDCSNCPRVYSQIKALMSGCLTMPANLESENLYLTLNDATVLRDFKTAYYLRNPNGVPEDCTNDFTAWINWTMGTSKTWCELVAIYNSILGPGSAYICGKEAAEDCTGGDSGKEQGTGGAPPATPPVYPPMLCGLNVEIFNPPPKDTSTCKDPMLWAINDGTVKWELYLDSLRRNFDTAYYNKCTRAKYLESFTVTYERAEHHFTLYYYDQGGQLVRTVPPEGVEDRRADGAFLTSVKTARNTNATTPVRPGHTLTTDYRYNTLGQVVQQKSPDGGLSKFWYDVLGRLVVSQNAEQAAPSGSPEGGGTLRYSYTLYDELGRIKEVGQKPQTTAMTQTISRDTTALSNWINGANNKEQLTRTEYDIAYGGTEFAYLLTQRNLRNRVSYTQVWNLSSESYARSATYYTYDIHGNVDTLLQDYGNSAYPNIMNQAGHRFKRMAYNYDLVSGKVNLVSYQPGYISPVTNQWVTNADRFYHRYSYDAENKLTMVETSHDSLLWERDATYSYYKHGPLARAVLGQQQVQGVDYAYNLQGWLKGVNSTAVGDGTYDIGGDGKTGGTNALVARDAYGFSLNYYQATVNSVTIMDYKSINTAVAPFITVNNANAFTGKHLFNGNISSMVVNIPKLGEAKVYQYGYDQLQRLLAVDVFEGLNNSNNTFTPVAMNDYKERLNYSANGNIQTYLRNGTGSTMNLNNYNYTYTSGTNRLASIANSVNGQTKTYSYDAIGNTTVDGMQGATSIVWNVYGKVQSLTNAQGQSVSYTYDAGGNRISKTVAGVTEWYVRDATGNNMATYTKSSAINSGNLTMTELYKYGSSLLSINTRQVNVEQPVTGEITTMQRGYDGYILSDHLGNTRAVITDRKLQHSSNGTTVDYYIADIKSATYYTAYGAAAKSYNQQPVVAFNGQRKSNEIGNDAQTALFWEYNGDVGRRWNVDPIIKDYESPYTAFGGNPIWIVDKNGSDSTIYLFSYKSKVPGASVDGPGKAETKKILKNVKKIFEANGFNDFQYKYVRQEDFVSGKLKLDATDVILGVVGSTGLESEGGSYIGVDGKIPVASKGFPAPHYSYYAGTLHAAKSKSNIAATVSFGVAHELLHQFLLKADKVFGLNRSGNGIHWDVNANLNATGYKTGTYLESNQITNENLISHTTANKIGHIVQWQKAYITGYLRAVNAGVSPTGSDGGKESTLKHIFPGSSTELFKVEVQMLKHLINMMVGNTPR